MEDHDEHEEISKLEEYLNKIEDFFEAHPILTIITSSMLLGAIFWTSDYDELEVAGEEGLINSSSGR